MVALVTSWQHLALKCKAIGNIQATKKGIKHTAEDLMITSLQINFKDPVAPV